MKILMVCLGNICRSPLADGMLRQRVKEEGFNVTVDSCGTSGHHAGEGPDSRMTATAKNKGLDITQLRSRQFTTNDFDQFDIIYVMDQSNENNVLKLARNDSDRKKVRVYLNELHPNSNMEVPDPYFGGAQGFEDVYQLVSDNTDIIIDKIKSNTLD